MWKKEYLTSLKEKFYGVSPKRPLTTHLKVGDVVIVQGNGPKADWPLGRIVQLVPSVDGEVRTVKLKMKTGMALRTVEKLIPLECDVDALDAAEEDDTIPVAVPDRPRRNAASRFRENLRNMVAAGDV